MKPTLTTLAVALGLWSGLGDTVAQSAVAQSAEAPAPEALPKVTVQGLKRDSAMMAYARTNDMLSRLKQHGQGLFDIEFQLSSDKGSETLPPVRLAIQTDRRLIPVPLGPQQHFKLPILDAEEAKDADLATDIPKGQKLSVQGSIRLTTPPADLDMAAVRRIVSVSHRLRSELLPWYTRWLFPRMDGVRICADQAPIELEWREQGQLMGLSLPIDPREKEDPRSGSTSSRHCTVLTGKEAWPDHARLMARPDMTLSIQGR